MDCQGLPLAKTAALLAVVPLPTPPFYTQEARFHSFALRLRGDDKRCKMMTELELHPSSIRTVITTSPELGNTTVSLWLHKWMGKGLQLVKAILTCSNRHIG